MCSHEIFILHLARCLTYCDTTFSYIILAMITQVILLVLNICFSVKEENSKAANGMIILVGLPGSGKSHFAQALVDYDPSNRFVRINQDQLKTRKKCEKRCKQALSNGKIPIIDRCNFDDQQRGYFVGIAMEYESRTHIRIPIHCVEFHCNVQDCIHRCKKRNSHETITQENAAGVVYRMASQIIFPSSQLSSQQSVRESPYERIIQIHNFEEAAHQVTTFLEMFRT